MSWDLEPKRHTEPISFTVLVTLMGFTALALVIVLIYDYYSK